MAAAADIYIVDHNHYDKESYWIPQKSMTSMRHLVLPMVSESMFCLSRIRWCFRAFFFVTSNPSKIRPVQSPFTRITRNIPKMMLTTIVRAIEMFRVENGMVLIFVSSDRSSYSDVVLQHIFRFSQSIDATDVTSVTLSHLNSINAIDVTRCRLMLIECRMFKCCNDPIFKCSNAPMCFSFHRVS